MGNALIGWFTSTCPWHVLLCRWSTVLGAGLWIWLVVSTTLLLCPNSFVVAAAQLNSSLLTISVIAVLLPGAFHMALQQGQDEGTLDQEILKTSHGVRNGVVFDIVELDPFL